MSHQHIDIEMAFSCPQEQLFQQLTDHVNFGLIVNDKIERVQKGLQGETDGVGSIRRITLLPGLSFEETVQTFHRPHLMEYQVTRGSPIKEHWGRLAFSATETGCILRYTIDFTGKLPGTGWLIKPFIEGPIKRGLARLQQSFL